MKKQIPKQNEPLPNGAIIIHFAICNETIIYLCNWKNEYVTWESSTEHWGSPYWGHYHQRDYNAAKSDYHKRVNNRLCIQTDYHYRLPQQPDNVFAISLIDETSDVELDLSKTFNTRIDAIKSMIDYPEYDKRMIDLSLWKNTEMDNMDQLFFYDPESDKTYFAMTVIPLPQQSNNGEQL